MSRWLLIGLVVLLAAVAIGGIYFLKLRQRVLLLGRGERTEEAARREVVQPPVATASDVKTKAKLFWASPNVPGAVEATEVELELSADPLVRSKQLLGALIAQVPTPEQRTLPADAALLEFYVLPDGTAVADFSDTLATATPSGILSEQMAVDSITRTLAANVEAIRRLKILIRGQEVETLAGHLDLAGFFPVVAEVSPAAPSAPPQRGGKAPAVGLTPPKTPGKLGR